MVISEIGNHRRHGPARHRFLDRPQQFDDVFGPDQHHAARIDTEALQSGSIGQAHVLGFPQIVETLFAGQLALTGRLTRRWGEAPVIKATLLASAVTFALLLAARDLTTILITTGLFTLPNALLRPAVISLISRRAGVYQGAAMGLNNSFNSLGRVVGPIWAGFAFDLDYNLPYLSGAIIMAAGFLVSLALVS